MSDTGDKAVLARLMADVVRPAMGTCRHCRCHGDSCSTADGEKCVWVDKLRTLCSNPACLRAAGKIGRRRKKGWRAA